MLRRVASVLAQIMKLEERCRSFAPPEPALLPRRQAFAAYEALRNR